VRVIIYKRILLTSQWSLVTGRRDTTLLSADAALKFCIAELDKQTTCCELAKANAAALHLRVKERILLASA